MFFVDFQMMLCRSQLVLPPTLLLTASVQQIPQNYTFHRKSSALIQMTYAVTATSPPRRTIVKAIGLIGRMMTTNLTMIVWIMTLKLKMNCVALIHLPNMDIIHLTVIVITI